MIDDLARGSQATSSRARIRTLELVAGAVRGTLGVDCTFGTAGWGTSEESGQAGAHALAVDSATLGVGTAGRGVARVQHGGLSG